MFFQVLRSDFFSKNLKSVHQEHAEALVEIQRLEGSLVSKETFVRENDELKQVMLNLRILLFIIFLQMCPSWLQLCKSK